ncbi:MAG: hypothetical protein RID09_06715 [Coleofasciculus sp. G1-WW12-02]
MTITRRSQELRLYRHCGLFSNAIAIVEATGDAIALALLNLEPLYYN